MFPINRPTLPPLKRLIPRLKKTLASGMLTNHIYVQEFEQKLAEYLGVKYAVCVNNCTSGLLLVAQALGLKGEVIVPSFTFPATVHILMWNNLKPVFVDCDPATFNINIEDVKRKITTRTSAILGVHIFGNPCPINQLKEIARTHRIKLFFDSAHALGAQYNTAFLGRFGEAEVFSFAPTKLITTGEGGVVTTHNKDIAERIRLARNYGNPKDYNCTVFGLNARLSELHAILGIESISLLEDNITQRYRLVKRYKTILGQLKGISFQHIRPQDRTTYNYFSVLIDPEKAGYTNLDMYQAFLKQDIMTRRYFYPPVHVQDAYREFVKNKRILLPHTDWVTKRILCLPLFSHMKNTDVEQVCKVFLHAARSIKH